MKRFLLILLTLLCFISCEKKKEIKPEVLAIPISFKVDRFDKKFADATPNDLAKLKAGYPYLFPSRFPDEFWVEKLQDTIQQEINAEVTKVFPGFKDEGDELTLLFKHIKYYFPEFSSPKVITVTSEVDYRNKIIISDSLMLIALDTYLGEDHFFYQGISNYISKNLKKEQLIPDVAGTYAKQLLGPNLKREFVGQMIYYGKMLYMIEQFAPFISEHNMIGYTEEEYNWSMANEGEIWRYFIEKKLLFSTDTKLPGRFLNPAPFSKFYLELDNESPGMLGRYIGWKIVQSYMENNDVSLQELINKDEVKLFQEAKYKPNK